MQYLTEVFKTCNGLSRLTGKLNELLFTLHDNLRATTAILGKLLNFGVHGTVVFFSLK